MVRVFEGQELRPASRVLRARAVNPWMSEGTDLARPPAAPGNQGLLRRLARTAPIQADAEVGRADDRFEREAHAVAASITGGGPVVEAAPPRIQRIADPGAVGLRQVPGPIDAAIEGARGAGLALPGEVAREMGGRLGADLGGVRVHTDERAHHLSRALGARAFTTGSDIFFRRGAYDPAGAAGRNVLAHELTHVVQQRGGSGGARPPVQRFIMQVGADDGYTTTMTKQLQDENQGEELLRFHAKWDKNWLGFKKGAYAPRTWHAPGGGHKLPWSERSKKLQGVSDAERLRIVGHGNIRGQIGGYTGEQMGALLLDLGLPATHTGGIDVHGCLPASNWTDPATHQVQPAHIVALEDYLNDNNVHETVRGYEQIINPQIRSEIDPTMYDFFELARALRNQPKGTRRALTAAEEALVRGVMGKDADRFFQWVLDAEGKVKDGFYFYHQASEWLRRKNLMKSAKLIDTTQPRSQLP